MRRARAIEKGRVPVEMDELVSQDDHATCDIGSISRSHTQEVTPGASGMTYQPINTEIVSYTMSQISRNTSNELDDFNDEVDNASEGGEPAVKKKLKIFLSIVGLNQLELKQEEVKWKKVKLAIDNSS
ncbi:hypothetical protein KY290_037059 [Solanum tuberosum]|uniref:Uncharacterized protein n=1 Tax=Solanum tuberosum TaxID=4113 RepID=A0ABQ7TUF3_SOLTU|nr:hypothetical protein KY290_037059 [Solanum tuberosum]